MLQNQFLVSPGEFRRKGPALLHEQHLAGPFHGTAEPPLIMRGQTGVLARQKSSLIRDELPQKGNVLVVERVHGEIDLRLGPWRADFAGCISPPAVAVPAGSFGVGFAWHNTYLISR